MGKQGAGPGTCLDCTKTRKINPNTLYCRAPWCSSILFLVCLRLGYLPDHNNSRFLFRKRADQPASPPPLRSLFHVIDLQTHQLFCCITFETSRITQRRLRLLSSTRGVIIRIVEDVDMSSADARKERKTVFHGVIGQNAIRPFRKNCMHEDNPLCTTQLLTLQAPK